MSEPRTLLSAEDVWRKYDAMEARVTAPLTERMVELSGLRVGMRVLDLATGRGEPAISAARRVGPAGSVVGVDLSAAMLAMASERAAREGVTNLELRNVNAASLEGIALNHFDATLVRWGLMYMDEPVQALIAARRAMVRQGVLVAAVWAEPECVPYFTLPRRLLEKYRTLPPVDFTTPGTFRYARAEALEQDLARAGFRVDHSEELELPVMEVQTAAELVEWTRAFGLTRLLNDLPEQTQRAWELELLAEAESLRTDGMIRLGGVTRIVVATSQL